MLNVGHAVIGQFERGERVPSLWWAHVLARTYLVSLDWLAYGSTDPAPK